MKLRLDEYYYIISDEIEDYMPQYMVEELDKFRESHTPEEAFDYLEKPIFTYRNNRYTISY